MIPKTGKEKKNLTVSIVLSKKKNNILNKYVKETHRSVVLWFDPKNKNQFYINAIREFYHISAICMSATSLISFSHHQTIVYP